jgi:hypothetical protein
MITLIKASLILLSDHIARAGSVEIVVPTWLLYSLIGYIAFRILRGPIVGILSAVFSILIFLARLAAKLLLGLLRLMTRRLVDRLNYIQDHPRESFSRMILVLAIIVLLANLDADKKTHPASEKTADTEAVPSSLLNGVPQASFVAYGVPVAPE